MKPEPNKVYTIGCRLISADRSYIGTLWRVVGISPTVVVVVSLEAQNQPTDHWHGKRHILQIDEYEWTPADHLVEVMYPCIEYKYEG